MYLKHTGFKTVRCGRGARQARGQALTSASANKHEAGPMRRESPTKPIIMKIYCRHPNFSRECLPSITPRYTWTRSRLQPPNSSHRLILIWCWASKASNCGMRGRCVEARLAERRPRSPCPQRRERRRARNGSVSSSRRTIRMKRPSKKTMTANIRYFLTRNMTRPITHSWIVTANSKRR